MLGASSGRTWTGMFYICDFCPISGGALYQSSARLRETQPTFQPTTQTNTLHSHAQSKEADNWNNFGSCKFLAMVYIPTSIYYATKSKLMVYLTWTEYMVECSVIVLKQTKWAEEYFGTLALDVLRRTGNFFASLPLIPPLKRSSSNFQIVTRKLVFSQKWCIKCSKAARTKRSKSLHLFWEAEMPKSTHTHTCTNILIHAIGSNINNSRFCREAIEIAWNLHCTKTPLRNEVYYEVIHHGCI